MAEPLSPQRLHHPLPSQNPTTPPKSLSQPPENNEHGSVGGYGQASTDTPFKVSSASVGNAATGSEPGPRYVEGQKPQVAITPPAQKQMDKYIESELRNAIFCDPHFTDRFLHGDVPKLDQVQRECQSSARVYDAQRSKGRWRLPKITSEKCLYEPLLDILNTIKRAVDGVQTPAPTGTILPGDESNNSDNGTDPTQDSSSDHDNDQSGDYDPPWRGHLVMEKRKTQPRTCSLPAPSPAPPPPPMFINTSRQSIASDRAETDLIKPDFVLFEDESQHLEHWEHVRMPVEVKQKTTYLKAAMKQLARYARAVFAHQIHRRHLYAMTICATQATFVRFDRAGMVYSPPIDLCEESDAFTRAFASLLMLDRTERGYDPAFSCELKEGRLDYYVILPKYAFTTEQPKPEAQSQANKPVETYKFRVVEIICHRRSIYGRATIVLRISRVDNDEEYILKTMWRDPRREPEGDVLLKVKGRYGLAQYVWHSDASGPCRCGSESESGNTRPWECRICVAETPDIDELLVCHNLTDLDIEVPPENQKSEQELQLEEVDTSVRQQTFQKRARRIYGFIVISSKGAPLCQAESPHCFMEAVLDAILGMSCVILEYAGCDTDSILCAGYWGLFNDGFLHRDISEGNVMLQKSGQEPERKCEDTETTDEVLIESEKKLKEILKELGRKPKGMLSDYDLHSVHSVVPATTSPVNVPKPMPSTATTPIDAPIPASTSVIPVYTSAASSQSSKNVRLREEDAEDATEDSRESKRRKTLSQPGGSRRNTPIAPASGQQNEDDKWIDFRTGTPAFMSIRVIQVEVGQRYNHSFLDDIESFFWLILWMAATHLDSGKRPTAFARDMLDLLSQQNPANMAAIKFTQLGDCTFGTRMRQTLQKFGNSWASSPLFLDIITNFGKLAFEYHVSTAENKELSPLDVFPQVVAVFQKALYPQLAPAAESA